MPAEGAAAEAQAAQRAAEAQACKRAAEDRKQRRQGRRLMIRLLAAVGGEIDPVLEREIYTYLLEETNRR